MPVGSNSRSQELKKFFESRAMIGIREWGIGHPLEIFLQDIGLIFGSRIEELMDGPVVA